MLIQGAYNLKFQDIRSYFTVVSKKSGSNSVKPSAVKKSHRILDSDEEDVVVATPEQKKKKKREKRLKVEIISSDSEDEPVPKKKRERRLKAEIISSDSEDESTKTKVPQKVKNVEPKLKPVNVADIFKSSPIKQSKVEVLRTPEVKPVEKKSKKKKQDAEKDVHKDSSFKQTLEDLDDEIFIQNMDILDKTLEEAMQNEEKRENKSESNNQVNERKRSRNDSSSDSKTPKKKKIQHADSGIDPGQEAHEKKRYSAMLYQKYLNRGEPKNHGMKELPKVIKYL